MNLPTLAKQFALTPPELVEARRVESIQSAPARDDVEALTKDLKLTHKSRLAAYESVSKPVREHLAQIRADLNIEAIEVEARRLLALIADFDRRQQAARSAQLIAAAQATAAKETPAPVVVEPAKPARMAKRVVIDSVDIEALPMEYHLADETAIRKAIDLGRAPAGVKYHVEGIPVWTK